MADGVLNRHLAEHYGLNRETVRYWRACWLELAPSLEEAESAHVGDARLRDVLRAGLSNRERGGAPVTFPRHELVIGDAPNNARTPR